MANEEVLISEDFRRMQVPTSQSVLGAYGDAWVRRVHFRAPRYCDGTDLSGYSFAVHFVNNEINEGYYTVTDLAVDGDELTFSWLVDPVACANVGTTTASISATDVVDGEIAHRFSSTLYAWKVLPAHDVTDESIIEQAGEMDVLIASWRGQVDDAIADAEDAAVAAQEAAENVRTMTSAAADTLFGSDTTTQTFAQRVSAGDGRCRVESLQGNTVVQDGELLSVNIEGIESVGFNQWDEVWEVGNIDSATGNPSAATDRIRSKNFIPVFPNTDYFIQATGFTRLYFYDGGENFISSPSALNQPRVFTTPANCRYLKFFSSESVVYRNNICINLSDPTRNGTYAPYTTDTLAIPAATYFPDGMRSAGDARDELTADAAVTRVGVVDLGTLSWAYSAADKRFYNTALPFKQSTNATSVFNVTCAEYSAISLTAFVGDLTVDKTISSAGQYLFVRNLSYTDPAAFKTAMSGVMLNYELATPTTQTIDPPLNLTYPTQQGGTESIVIPTGENSAPPVLVTTQARNADGVADMALSQVAPVENGTASANYAVGSYLVHGGTLYRVTSAIATGETITAGTNVTATTVMAELVRLTQ